MNLLKNNTTLKDYYDRKNNIFSIISFLMSLIIIYYHAYPLYYGINLPKIDPISKVLNYSIAEIVVNVFLIFSGFNIVKSLMNSDSYFKFFLKRVLKIIPDLLISLLLGAFVIAPIVLKVSIFSYLINPSYYFHYIFDNLILIRPTVYSISIVFSNLPYPNVLNGSIWTIKHIFSFYFILAFFKKIKLLNKRKNILIFTLMLLVINILSETGIINPYLNFISKKLYFIGIFGEFKWFIKLFYFFMTGVCLDLYQDKVKINIQVISISFLLLIISNFFNLMNYTFLFFLPYLIIIIASSKNFFKIKQIDISYQIYVYAFLIQQFIIYLLPNINFSLYIILSILVTILLSFMTYYLVDKPLSILKRKCNL